MSGCMSEDHYKQHWRLTTSHHKAAFLSDTNMPVIPLLAPLATLAAALLVSSSIRGIVQGKSKSTARLVTHLEQLARENERLRQELRRRQRKAISEHHKST